AASASRRAAASAAKRRPKPSSRARQARSSGAAAASAERQASDAPKASPSTAALPGPGARLQRPAAQTAHSTSSPDPHSKYNQIGKKTWDRSSETSASAAVPAAGPESAVPIA